VALYTNCSRAFGTAGTTPFASDLSALNAAKVMLKQNGAPDGDMHLVLDYDAAYNLGNLTQLTNVNQAGASDVLRQGQFTAPIFGFNVHVDDNISSHTVGTSTGQDANGGEPVGETSIVYDGGNGGTILVGDTISFTTDNSGPGGADSHYVVNTAVTAAAGTIVINSPGLLATLADTTEIALGSTDYTYNMAFSRDAFVLGARAPKGDDAAVDETIIVDPLTGIPFRLAKYEGHHMTNYEMSILFGVMKGNPEHSVILFG